MANNTFSIDIGALRQQLQEKQSAESKKTDVFPKTSIFTLGQDKAVLKEAVSNPQITYISLLKDGLNNLYVEINWRTKKTDADINNVAGFRIFRRKLRPEEAQKNTSITTFDRNAFDKLSIKNLRTGKFSEEKKAIYNIKRSMINDSNLNNNLSTERAVVVNRTAPSATQVIQPSFDNNLDDYSFKQIGYVDLSQFTAQQKNKFLYVSDRNYADLYFTDKTVNYGEVYEYYIETAARQLGIKPRTGAIAVAIEDLSPVEPIVEAFLKQVGPHKINIQLVLKDDPTIWKILVEKRAENQSFFTFLADLKVLRNSILFSDANIKPTKSYIYRFYVQNIFGRISAPKIVNFTPRHKVASSNASFVTNSPLLLATRDENSNSIKINIFCNDEKVSYYTLERRDLTIYENSFSVPSQANGNYGGSGWITNQFFVEKIREVTDSSLQSFSAKTTLKPIEFLDTTTTFGHTYQYRVRGYNLAGVGGSYSLCTIASGEKTDIRAPVNLKVQTLRQFPLRLKISWDDDNLKNNLQNQNLFTQKENNVKIVYKVQRRKHDESTYETFPLTQNKFIIDEIPCFDPVDFENQNIKLEGFDQPTASVPFNAEQINQINKVRRTSGMPGFLQTNAFYYYRVIAISETNQSNPSSEFFIRALIPVANPIKFIAELVNPKVRPSVVRLFWQIEQLKTTPSYFTIERKVTNANEPFKLISKVYLENEFLDFHVTPGYSYTYRIQAIDVFRKTLKYKKY